MTDSIETIPARHGKAIRLAEGQAVKVVNTHGTQVVDTWAFCAEEPAHHMSMEHSRVENGRLCPVPGQSLYTNRREEILVLDEDSWGGLHDTLMAACDRRRYERLGAKGHHRSCADNLLEAMAAIGVDIAFVPQPLNLFMNIPIGADGSLEQGVPTTRPGDHVVLRAVRDCIVAFSACPQDMTPINGIGREPRDAHFCIMGSS